MGAACVRKGPGVKVYFFTITLNGFPFLTWLYPVFRQLSFPWVWIVVEGTAMPKRCTSWCAQMPPVVSTDGTHAYLRELSNFDPRVIHSYRPGWDGKVAMCNEAIARMESDGLNELEDSLIWQIDSDEVWNPEQLELGRALLSRASHCNCAYFRCRYFCGPDIVITTKRGFGNNTHEWKRLWKIRKGIRFSSHEPPVLDGFTERAWERTTTAQLGLVFDHFALATEAQVAWKERYYGSAANPKGHLYKDAVKGWRRLQENTKWPVQLCDYLKWVGPGVEADKIDRSAHVKYGAFP